MAGTRLTVTVIGKSPQTDGSTIVTLQGNSSMVQGTFQLRALNTTVAALFTIGTTMALYVYPTTDKAAVEGAASATAAHKND